MLKLTGSRKSHAALLLAGIVIGWCARVFTSPADDSGALPLTRQAFENRGVQTGLSTSLAKTGAAADTAEGAPGVVSSSLASGFDFPAEWDATQCARESLKELNEFRRMQMFQRAMQRLTPESAARMQEVFNEAADAGKWYFIEYPFFLRRWAEIDGKTAIEFSVNRGGNDPNGWHSLIRQTLSGWAVNDPEAAVQWINGKEEITGWVQTASIGGIIDGLTEPDPDRAVSFVLAQAEGEDRNRLFRDLTERLIYGPGMARAEQWLQQIPGEPEYAESKRRVFAQIIDRQMRGEPEEAAAFISRNATEPWLDPASVQRVAQALQKKPEKYAAWRDSLPAGLVSESAALSE